MPRDSSGNYTFPVGSGNPVITNELITSNWANTTLNDLKAEMTDSLSRDGKGGFNGQFKLDDGAENAPAIAFNSEPTLGMYRKATTVLGFSTAGIERLNISNSGLSVIGATTMNGNLLMQAGAAQEIVQAFFTDTGGIQQVQSVNGNHTIRQTNAIGTVAEGSFINLLRNAGVELYFGAAGAKTKKFETTINGIEINAFAQTAVIDLKTDTAGLQAVQRYLNTGGNKGAATRLNQTTGNFLTVQTDGAGSNSKTWQQNVVDGAVELYHNNTKKFETSAGGATVTGTITATTFAGNATTATTATNCSRSILAGNGLTGGGALTANRTVTVGAGSGITVAASTVAVDTTVIRTTGNQSMSGVKTLSGGFNSTGGNFQRKSKRILVPLVSARIRDLVVESGSIGVSSTVRGADFGAYVSITVNFSPAFSSTAAMSGLGFFSAFNGLLPLLSTNIVINSTSSVIASFINPTGVATGAGNQISFSVIGIDTVL